MTTVVGSQVVRDPKVEDSLHLGKLGIRLLANSIKQAVVDKTRSQSEARFTGGRGGFRSAAERGTVRQGYHQSHLWLFLIKV